MGAGFPTGHGVAISEAGVWLARRGVPVCDLVARSIGRGMRESAIDRAAQVVTFHQAHHAGDSPADMLARLWKMLCCLPFWSPWPLV